MSQVLILGRHELTQNDTVCFLMTKLRRGFQRSGIVLHELGKTWIHSQRRTCTLHDSLIATSLLIR